MIVLLGVLVVILGFVTRRNPVLVVGVAGIVTGLLGKMSPLEVLAAFGQSFADSRSVTVFAIVLPVIGLLERYGLREQARTLIGRLGKLSAGRFLAVYLLIRQVTAAFGLNSIGGPAQTVRPLVAPMAEAAAERTDRRPAARPAAREGPLVRRLVRHRRRVLRRGLLHRDRLDPADHRVRELDLPPAARTHRAGPVGDPARRSAPSSSTAPGSCSWTGIWSARWPSHAAENDLPLPHQATASRTRNGSEEAGK